MNVVEGVVPVDDVGRAANAEQKGVLRGELRRGGVTVLRNGDGIRY